MMYTFYVYGLCRGSRPFYIGATGALNSRFNTHCLKYGEFNLMFFGKYKSKWEYDARERAMREERRLIELFDDELVNVVFSPVRGAIAIKDRVAKRRRTMLAKRSQE